MFGLLPVGMLLSVPIYPSKGRAALSEAHVLAMNDAIVNEARAMQAAQYKATAESWKARTEIVPQGGTILHPDRNGQSCRANGDLLNDSAQTPKEPFAMQILLGVANHPKKLSEKNLSY